MISASKLMTWALRGLLVMAAVIALPGAPSAQEPRKITIAISSNSIPAGAARISNEMGLFAKHGLAATVTPMDTGAVASAALMSGAVNFVTTGPSDVVVAQGRGLKIVALTAAYRGFAATIVLSKAAAEKTGVSATAPVEARLKALNGLKIASTSASSTFTIAPKAATEGVGAKVDFVYMAQPAMVAALQRGIVDGITVAAPYYVQPVLSGTGVVWISGPRGDFPKAAAPVNSVVVLTQQAYAVANPDLMRQVSAVFSDFWKAIDERPAEVKAAMAKIWPDLEAQTLDLVFQTEGPGFKAQPLTVEEMAHEIAFMKLGGADLPRGDSLDPAAMIFK